jgi:hypothetical protein
MTAPKDQTVKAKYVCLGERALEAKKILGISPSAEKVLSSYIPEVIRILGSRKDGFPDWGKGMGSCKKHGPSGIRHQRRI